ncbi:hypothetical protein M1D88_07210 [Arthrobacter sp. R1-13]
MPARTLGRGGLCPVSQASASTVMILVSLSRMVGVSLMVVLIQCLVSLKHVPLE